MSVPEQTPYKEYTANGVTTSFAVTFQCLSKDTLIVTINGVEQSPTLWSFTGGNVVFIAAPANLAIVGIKRSTALKREVTYQTYDNSLRPDVLNSDIDRLWHVLQENKYIYDAKVDKTTNIQTLGNLQGGGQINGGLTLSLKDQTVTANYAFGSSIKIPVIELNQDGTVKSLHDVDLIGGAGGAFQIDWSDVLNKPTTLTGYGITNAYTKTEINTALAAKEDGANKGVAGGFAGLDENSLVPVAQLPSASTMQAGTVQLNNTLTSTSTTQALTAAQGKVLNDQAFGVGQDWQDMTASRALNTVYTNTTGKSIAISVVENGIDGYMELTIAGFIIAKTGNFAAAAANDQNTVFGIVPPMATYKFTTKTLNYSYIKWWELR